MLKSDIRNVAFFIDFENYNHAVPFDVAAIFQMINVPKEARFIIRRAYSDWSKHEQFKQEMLENSVELIEMPTKNHYGKNSVDVKLSVDAIETAIAKDYVDTFVIVSGDSDYTPLLAKLREYNKYVIVVGHSKTTSRLLAGYCDEIIYYSNLMYADVADAEDIGDAHRLLVTACRDLEKEGIPCRGAQVKWAMRRLDPSFSESEYGFRQWRPFLEHAERSGVVGLKEIEGNDYLVAPVEKVT